MGLFEIGENKNPPSLNIISNAELQPSLLKTSLDGEPFVVEFQQKSLPERRISSTALPPMGNREYVQGQQQMAQLAVEKAKEESEKAKLQDIDPAYVIDGACYQRYEYPVRQLVQAMGAFDIPLFLSGQKEAFQVKINIDLMTKSVASVQELAAGISKEREIGLKEAYQMVVGILDAVDEKSGAKQSSFPVRSAILLASHKNGVGLDSWVVYTKGGKPKKNIWPFVEKWKNWVPEAQGSMAKFIEGSFIKAKSLSIEHPENTVYLLKGGFGAGKTRQTKLLFREHSEGSIAPDKGKKVVRRSLPEIPHSAAHIQGSQLAFALFEEICEMPGASIYDSSLYDPKDIQRYLRKAEKAGKKVVILDVTRKDIARVLAVLKRDVVGEDPRIPPERIKGISCLDKLNRVKCMETVLNYTSTEPANFPEYHFYVGDEMGWNSQKVAILTPGKIGLLNGAKKRLNSEGLSWDDQKGRLHSDIDEAGLNQYYDTYFEKRVKTVLKEVSQEEKKELKNVFSKRVISFNDSDLRSLTSDNCYSFLHDSLKDALSEKDFDTALRSVTDTARKRLIRRLKRRAKMGLSITYLDLPLKVALALHASLKEDPWK